MFVLYAVLIGVVLGVLLGGDAARLTQVSFHWKLVVFVALIFQVVLFAPFVADRIGDLGPLLYIGSTAAVLATVIRNARITGLPVVVLGALSNLAAIVANGGYMPASAAAMTSLGKTPPEGYSNSALLLHPALAPLTDIFALPRWVPFANVFSVGDVLIAVGVVWAIVATMRSGSFAPASGINARLLRRGMRAAAGGARRHLTLVTGVRPTDGPFAAWDSRRTVRSEEHKFPHWDTVQGKPVVRRGTQS
jgi:hypothetical protein